MSEELVETVARVMYVQQLTGGDYGWNDLPQWKREPWRKSARAAIGVTLDAVRERLEGLLDEGRDGAGYEAGLRAALESLGGEE